MYVFMYVRACVRVARGNVCTYVRALVYLYVHVALFVNKCVPMMRPSTTAQAGPVRAVLMDAQARHSPMTESNTCTYGNGCA